MSSANGKTDPHSKPIPISTRRRPESVSDSSSSDSGSPTSPLQTPPSATGLPRVAPLSPSSSPVLSYFLNQSPKSPTTFPFRRNFGPPVFEEDSSETETPTATNTHARRATTAWGGTDRFSTVTQPTALPDNQQDRAAGLLRRLSLGGARPQALPQKVSPQSPNNAPQHSGAPPNSPVVERSAADSPRRTRRANTVSQGSGRPRAPSPMGERILKGHFDGFN